ncbi:hypothetical protein [Nonomuraea insulae]|uniref:ATP-grasp domain-containing protein n=1 Tax=Nonomuraea insulae TaxID=1616787 RepID=A0ABW1DA50_9ACTN
MIGTVDPVRRFKTALTGSPGTPLVLVGNFDVEEQWSVDEPGLPRPALSRSALLTHCLGEFALLLAGSDDHVVLKASPDETYLAHLKRLGLELPRISVVVNPAQDRTVTEDALADPALLADLAHAARRGARLWPHGVSAAEELLAERTGVELAGPSARVCKTVNSKIYSRTISADLGIRQPPGMVCASVADFEAACATVQDWLAAGRTVVLKDAYGVSGKGLLVVSAEGRLGLLRRMIHRQSVRLGTDRLSLVMEEWLPKRADLNYQFTLGRDGAVHFDFVKGARTEAGVHKGHLMPAELSSAHRAELVEVCELLGTRLAADGYSGVVGVDAIVTTDGVLQPVIEINARNNLSTYQERLSRLWSGDGQVAIATHHSLAPRPSVSFAEFARPFADLVLAPGARAGVLVINFATVGAGRLYVIVVGESRTQVDALDREMSGRLAAYST